jgi:hypothetical protein
MVSVGSGAVQTEYGLLCDQVEVLNKLMSDDNIEQLESIVNAALV